MGMSASQARLIALTARMNDIEYQGQQINQQRTTLANQINALYSSLLDMSVPTPPAKSDFTVVQYGGNLDASKFTLGTVTPAGKYADTDIQLYNIDLNFSTTGLAVTQETGKTPLKYTAGKQYYSQVDTQTLTNALFTKREVIEKSDSKPIDFSTIQEIDNEQDVMLKISASDYNTVKDEYANRIYTMNEDGTFSLVQGAVPTTGDLYVQTNAMNMKSPEAAGSLSSIIFSEEGKYKENLVAYKTNSEETTQYVPKENADFSGFYVEKNGKPVQLTYDDIKNVTDPSTLRVYGKPSVTQPTDGNFITEKIGDGSDIITVGTSDTRVYDANDPAINNKYDDIDDCRTALKNSFPRIAQSLAEGEDIMNKFYVYFEETTSGKIKPHFILKSDIEGQLNNNTLTAKTYQFDEDGTYMDSQEKKGARLQFDSSGRITEVGIPVTDANGNISTWTWVKVAMTETTDNDAYDDAFNEYEYKKYLYDKEQQAINAKTSIIQAEDKNLELKLTRLDNERNAVNTEIEAVKKVVNDNIEKSFKTFSG